MNRKLIHLGLLLSLALLPLLNASPVHAEVTPWTVDDFWNYPYDPSIFDSISFGLYGEAPPDWTCHWDFGDGTTYDECWVNQAKQFQQDGDYTVSVQVTNSEGEISSPSRVVSVRTHDVAITRFAVPKSASAGQTRQLTVYVRNARYPENVQVDLLKSTAGGYEWFASLAQLVPVRSGNRTTAFSFNYTFTAEDVRMGKVTFKALAILLDDRDALPADNEAISLPTRVSR